MKMNSKREANKIEKEKRLLEAAQQLFLEQGIQNTSISDIVKAAGVAKGTYYLYFQDKAAIEERLIVQTSSEIIAAAFKHASQYDKDFEQRFLIGVDYIIDYLKENMHILEFINKNLSYAVYQLKEQKDSRLLQIITQLQERYIQYITPEHINDVRTIISLCIEFLGASIYSALVYEMPCPIDELRPHIHKVIHLILDGYRK